MIEDDPLFVNHDRPYLVVTKGDLGDEDMRSFETSEEAFDHMVKYHEEAEGHLMPPEAYLLRVLPASSGFGSDFYKAWSSYRYEGLKCEPGSLRFELDWFFRGYKAKTDELMLMRLYSGASVRFFEREQERLLHLMEWVNHMHSLKSLDDPGRLRELCRVVLNVVWAPLGHDLPEDEYDSYLDQILALEKVKVGQINRVLVKAERAMFGGNVQSSRLRAFPAKLIEWLWKLHTEERR